MLRMKYDPEESITITDMIDCPSVELKLDVGDVMYDNVVEYAKASMTDQDYFKAGFGMMINSLGDKLVRDPSGQLVFDFNT